MYNISLTFQMQDMWNTYVLDAHSCCPATFWTLYSSVLDQSVTCQDAVLKVVKKTFPIERKGRESWPADNRCVYMSQNEHICYKMSIYVVK